VSGTPEALARAVSAVARRIPGATCLTQALALDLLLRRRGVVARLVVGVSNRGERFGAHAWLEYEGRVLIGGDVRHYQPFRTRGHTSQ
jgi:hypothetical protein